MTCRICSKGVSTCSTSAFLSQCNYDRLYFNHNLYKRYLDVISFSVSTVVTAHRFCASRDTRISYRRRSLIQGYFCAVQNHAEKAELSKCSWHPKRNLGVTMHFSKIIKLHFGKERHTLFCILKLFTNIVD